MAADKDTDHTYGVLTSEQQENLLIYKKNLAAVRAHQYDHDTR